MTHGSFYGITPRIKCKHFRDQKKCAAPCLHFDPHYPNLLSAMPPSWALCPLEKKILVDPVIDHEGNTYSQEAILAYLEHFSVSPVTGNRLQISDLKPNDALDRALKKMFAAPLTPPPFSPLPKRITLSSCNQPSCIWCPQCALYTFCHMAHPSTWPLFVYNAIFHADPPKLNFSMRFRVGIFLYSNGAWQDFDLFYNIMKPRLSPHVKRRYIMSLFQSFASPECKDTTTDANLCNDTVLTSGIPATTPYTSLAARKVGNWDRYINHLMCTSRSMPSYAFANAFFSTDCDCADPRIFKEICAL